MSASSSAQQDAERGAVRLADDSTHKDEDGLTPRVIDMEDEEPPEDLLLRLQLEEINDLDANSKGKQRTGLKNDFQVALDLHQNELQSLFTFNKDRRMARSMVQALHTDGNVVDAAAKQEAMAVNDRNIAQAISQTRSDAPLRKPSKEASERQPEALNPSLEENLKRLAQAQDYEMMKQYREYSLKNVDHRIPTAESSSTAARREPKTYQAIEFDQPEVRRCVSCTDEFPLFDLVNLPCTHDYCRTCLTKLFADSMVDETLFPPRCCRVNIVQEYVLMFLDPSIAEQFSSKREELETANRVYCRVSTCSSFVPPSAIKDSIATCVKCGETTCSICKSTTHEGLDCPEDTALEAVLEVARVNHWQRCYSCWRLVELSHGCNHITCPCGANFCYGCGAIWGTCACGDWTEARLLERAQTIHARDAGRRQQRTEEDRAVYEPEPNGVAPVPAERPVLEPFDAAAAIHRIMEDIRVNHECEHQRWRYIPGRHRCEECTHWLPQYIFECRQCRLRACNRCRRNRL